MKTDITFCALELNIDQKAIDVMLSEVRSVEQEHWYWDSFRGCSILPLINGNGTTGAPNGVSRAKGNMTCTEASYKCPTTIEIIENKVFSFMDLRTRVSVLKTQANKGLNVHVDSGRKSLDTRQHKFRIVLSGEIDKLYFLDSNNQKQYVPNDYNCYVLDGTHPHSIDPGTEEKITICFGTPWTGNHTDAYYNLIKNSPYKIKYDKPMLLDEWLMSG
jgi:hypothetical protein